MCWTGWGLGIVLSAAWGFQNFAAPKQDFAGAIAFAEAQAGPDDHFGTFGLSALPIARYYRPDWAVYEDAADLDADIAAGPTWVVIGFEDHSQANYPDVFARLKADFDRVEKRKGTLGGGTVLVYRSRAGE